MTWMCISNPSCQGALETRKWKNWLLWDFCKRGDQSQINPVSASAMLTGKFLQILKVFVTSSLLAEEFLYILENVRILYPHNMQSVRMNWKLSGWSKKCRDELESFYAYFLHIWKLMQFTRFVWKVFATKILLSGKFSLFSDSGGDEGQTEQHTNYIATKTYIYILYIEGKRTWVWREGFIRQSCTKHRVT